MSAHIEDFFQLVLGIKRSVFCRMGNIYHSRKYHMVMTFISVKSFDIFGYTLCFDLSVLCRKCQNLMSGILDSTGFMAVYMSSLSCQYPLVSVQHGTDNCRIGLSSSYQKKHLCIRTATGFSDLFFCRITVFVRAIA